MQLPVVHIIEDDPALQRALDRLFRSADISTRLYGSAQDFLVLPFEDAPGCLLIDIRLPGVDGLDFHESLKERGVLFPAVIMTGYGDVSMSVRAMKAGAVDFLPKPFEDQDLLSAIQAAFEKDAVRREIEARKLGQQVLLEKLSPRERQVFEYVVQGRLNKQIAGDLGLAEITVKTHRAAMMRKLRVRSLAELVRIAKGLDVLRNRQGEAKD